MILKLENVGNISNAEINFGDVSLIAGENGTGKSTIGKAFLLMHRLIVGHKDYVQNKLESFYFESNDRIKRLLSYISDDVIKNISQESDGENLIKIREFAGKIDSIVKSSFKLEGKGINLSLPIIYREEEPPGVLSEKERLEYKKVVNDLVKCSEKIWSPKRELNLEKSKNKREKSLNERISNQIGALQRNAMILDSLTRDDHAKELISGFFGDNIISIGKKSASIKVEDSGKCLCEVKISRTLVKVSLTDESILIYPLVNVIYIETPLLLEYLESTSIYGGFRFVGFGGFEAGLSKKVNEPLLQALSSKVSSVGSSKQYMRSVSEFIKKCLDGGTFVLEKSYHSKISFRDKESNQFDMKNVATGIKNFGIIAMLLENNALNDRTVLIIDEPEVHLHPKWKTRYSELLVRLAEKGVAILVATHDVFVLRTLEYYSEKKKLSLRCYLAEKGNIRDVSSDTEPIYDSLAEPFQEKIWSDR